MKKPKLILAFLLFALSVLNGNAQENTNVLEELKKVAIIDQKVMMPMRDGVRLSTDIYRPKGDGKYPIIFSRTPYNFNSYRDGELVTRTMQTALEAVQKGYAYVVQNERGRFFSEGEWDILGTPTTDGYDAFTWMAAQKHNKCYLLPGY
ncbi:MAG: CocE/NonD family hydrolase, partial [Cytophagia bacterium]|nr:CocE/NonD family hydrolase [Cytophagia bacterium]